MDDSLPPAVRVLSEDYQEAYRLLPSGPWAQRYYAERFDNFDMEAFELADDTEPVAASPSQYNFDPGKDFNLNRVLKDESAKEWVEAKVGDLAPAYKDEFANADTPEERLSIIKTMVSTDDVLGEVIMAELFVRWEALAVGTTEAEADHFVALVLHMEDNSRALWQLSQKGVLIRLNEIQVCELIMIDIVHAGHTMGVVANSECDLPKVVELANQAIANGSELPTEADYQQRVE